jgi:transcription antitermination factor NusG
MDTVLLEDNQSDRNWYALRVKARSEKLVAVAARRKGYEEFVPMYCSPRRWSDRTRVLDIPLFPGYVLCRLASQTWLPLLTIPGALHFVRIGKTPIPIDGSEMHALRRATQSGFTTEPWPFLDSGPTVRLQEGPLAGLEGRLVEIGQQCRMVLSVTLLKRSVAVEVNRVWIPCCLTGPGTVITPPPPDAVRLDDRPSIEE